MAFKDKLKRLFDSEFSKHVTILTSGTLIAQIVPLLISPILSRLYTPTDYGIFTVFTGIYTIGGAISTGKYEMAILLPKSREEAISLTMVCIMICTTFCLLLYLPAILLQQHILDALHLEGHGYVLYLLPIMIWLVGIYQSFNYWGNRLTQYKRLAFSRVIRSTGKSAFTVGLAATSLKKAGLIVGDFLGQAISTFTLIYYGYKNDHIRLFADGYKGLKRAAVRYFRFPKFSIPSTLFENLSSQAPVFMLGGLYGSVILGYFGITLKIINIPSMLISSAIGEVFRQKASLAYQQNGNCRYEFISTLKVLLFIAVVPYAVFFLIAPYLFNIVLGKQWYEAGVLSRYMVPLFIFQFVVSPLSGVLYIAEKQHVNLLLQMSLFVAIIIAIYIGYYFFESYKISISLFTLTYCVKYIIELFLSYKYSLGKKV